MTPYLHYVTDPYLAPLAIVVVFTIALLLGALRR